MSNNLNYELILSHPDNDNNLHNNNNESIENNDNQSNKITISILLIISLSLVCLDFYSLYQTFNYLNYHLKSNNDSFYNQCIESKIILEIVFIIFATLAGISGTILSIGFLVKNELFLEKIFVSFGHFNYFIFGPFLFANSIFGLINFQKIGYSCEADPEKSNINLSILICLIIILTFGSVITAGYSTINIFEYFYNSLKCKSDANYLIGKAFWKYALSKKRNRRNLHERSE